MTITLGWWLIPAVLSLLCLVNCWRESSGPPGPLGMGSLLAPLWLVPIGFIWAVYFGLWLGIR